MDMLFLILPVRLVDAAALAESLRSRRGKASELRLGQVEQVGTAALQVLLSAAATWRKDGHGLRVAEQSSAFDNALATLGIPSEAFVSEGVCQ